MEFNAKTAGGRQGGPNLASEEDDESSQHSNSESSGSQSVSQEAGSQVPGASTSESIQSGCQRDDDGSDAELDLDHDDSKDPGMEAAMDLMKRMDEGAEASEEELKNIEAMLLNKSTHGRINHRIKRDAFHELDQYFNDVPMAIPHTQFFDKSIVEWSNIGYMLPHPGAYGVQDQAAYSPTQSTWAYNAPMSPTGYVPPPSPWAYPQQVPGASAIRTDWPLPQGASASPQISSSMGQPSSSLPPFSTFSHVSASVPPAPTIPSSPPQQFSRFPSQPSQTASAVPPPPSWFTGQPLQTASAVVPPPPSTFTGQPSSTGSPSHQTLPGQPASADQPSASRVPPGIGMSYMYASQASRVVNINADQDTAIVSSILSNVYSRGGAYGGQGETSPRKKFKGHVAKLHAAVGLNDEEREKTQREWDEIVSEVQERTMDQKSFIEKCVDFETLLHLYQLSLLMYTYFTVPPQSILETFEMAYRIRKLGRPGNPPELKFENKSSLAKRLSNELLGIVPRYEDFPVPYMAGIEVPEKWFFHRFKHMGGYDRLRYCNSGSCHTWVTPTRYVDRQKLRFCYVRPEIIARDYPYDRNSLPNRKDPRVWDLVGLCAGPPFKPLPGRKHFINMNLAVLRNYMIRFKNYTLKIKEIEQQQKKQVQIHNDRIQVTLNQIAKLESNYEYRRAGYDRNYSGHVLRAWNTYFHTERDNRLALVQRMADVAQVMLLLTIKYSDGWSFKINDMEEMFCHRIPLFDAEIVDERPQQAN